MPSAPQPALATLSHDRFWEPGWVYERKLVSAAVASAIALLDLRAVP